MWILDQVQVEDSNLSQKIAHRKALRRRLIERDGDTCVWCAKTELSEVTMDHVVPDSKGGPMTSYNLVPACRSCNSSRQNTPALVWYRRCLARGMNPNGPVLVTALRDTLLYGGVDAKYSLYDITIQLQAPEFAEILYYLGGPLSGVED
jgi:HNH endonuclease